MSKHTPPSFRAGPPRFQAHRESFGQKKGGRSPEEALRAREEKAGLNMSLKNTLLSVARAMDGGLLAPHLPEPRSAYALSHKDFHRAGLAGHVEQEAQRLAMEQRIAFEVTDELRAEEEARLYAECGYLHTMMWEPPLYRVEYAGRMWRDTPLGRIHTSLLRKVDTVTDTVVDTFAVSDIPAVRGAYSMWLEGALVADPYEVTRSGGPTVLVPKDAVDALLEAIDKHEASLERVKHAAKAVNAAQWDTAMLKQYSQHNVLTNAANAAPPEKQKGRAETIRFNLESDKGVSE